MRTFLCKYGTLRIKMPVVPRMHFSVQKIGLFGGSFNPLHLGHVQAANEVMRRLKLDQLWFLITPGNPLKSHKELTATQDRLVTLQKKIQNYRIKALSIEEALGTPFTSRVISYLKGRYPTIKFIWIMGADNLAEFHLWQDWKFIAEHIPFVIVDRPGYRYRALASPVAKKLLKFRVREESCPTLMLKKAPAWAFLKNKQISISSSQLRTKTKNIRDAMVF